MRPVATISALFSIISSVISVVSFIAILVAISPFAPLIMILLAVPSAVISYIYRKKNFLYMRRRSRDRREMNYYNDVLVNKDLDVYKRQEVHMKDGESEECGFLFDFGGIDVYKRQVLQ